MSITQEATLLGSSEEKDKLGWGVSPYTSGGNIMANIYLASPFFNEEELKHVEKAEQVLRALGHTVFSPRENQLPEVEFGSFEWRTFVFKNDLEHIKWADMVFGIIGENYDDTGTAWELGAAYILGKPVLLFNPKGEIINLMITDSLHAYFEDMNEVARYDFATLPIKPYLKPVK
ncbi:nucleoside 2-deoxyribosyltransferase [Bacillus paranthracis]|nr:nucleoside deoxyribosyltransferase [Bacillus thuringiensis serovar israelensis ATCC 35646]